MRLYGTSILSHDSYNFIRIINLLFTSTEGLPSKKFHYIQRMILSFPLEKEIYLKYCASCHGEQLQGQSNWRQRDAEGYLPAPPHDESGHTWHHSDTYLFLMTKYGIEKDDW